MAEPNATRKDSRLRLITRRVLTVLLTLTTLALAGALVMGGRAVLAERAGKAGQGRDPAPAMTVEIGMLTLQDGYQVERRFSGLIEAAQRTVLGFELAGTVERLLVDEGARVATGAQLARLDTRLLQAERDRLAANRKAVAAQAELARRTMERQDALQAKGFASTQALDDASLSLVELEARMGEIDAALAGVDIRLEKSVLRAPFAGTITMRHVDTGASVGAGNPVLTVVERGGARFRVGVPPALIEDARKDATVAFGKRLYAATFDSASPELDAATRTREVLMRIRGDRLPAFGETGILMLQQHVPERGAFVPLAALRDGPRGLWQLTTVSEVDGATVTALEAVELLFSDGERAYVRGTFRDGARYITDGPHRVVPGQRVRLAAGPA